MNVTFDELPAEVQSYLRERDADDRPTFVLGECEEGYRWICEKGPCGWTGRRENKLGEEDAEDLTDEQLKERELENELLNDILTRAAKVKEGYITPAKADATGGLLDDSILVDVRLNSYVDMHHSVTGPPVPGMRRLEAEIVVPLSMRGVVEKAMMDGVPLELKQTYGSDTFSCKVLPQEVEIDSRGIRVRGPAWDDEYISP